jgi:hypothetical protein
MTTRRLDKAEWRVFLDRMSKGLAGKRAEIEVASLGQGAQIAAEWLPLLGVAYDPKDDLLEVALDGFDHLIHHPREVYVDEGGAGLATLEIVDGDGARQIVKFRDPLMLPPAATAG